MSSQTATGGEQGVQHSFNLEATREEIVNNLPESGERVARSKVTLLFIAQAMVGDQLREVSDGRYEFTVPLSHIRRESSIPMYDDQWAIYDKPDGGHYVDDNLKSHGNNREEFRAWDGPFEIRIKSVSIQPPNAFGGLETVTLEDVPVDALRTVISLALLKVDQPVAKWFHNDPDPEQREAAIERVLEVMDEGIDSASDVDGRDADLIAALAPFQNGDTAVVDATPRHTGE